MFDDVLESMVEDIFLCYDANEDGVLNKEEIEEFTSACLESMESDEDKMFGVKFHSASTFDNFWEKYDTNGDGVIGRDELMSFIKNVVLTSVEKVK